MSQNTPSPSVTCDHAIARIEDKIIPFGFTEVATGILNRYPNPLAKHVLCTDTIEAFTVDEDGQLSGKSLTLKTNPMPKLFNRWDAVKLLKDGIKAIALIEEYRINLFARTVQHLSRNITSRDYLKTHELVHYSDPTTDQVQSRLPADNLLYSNNESPESVMLVNKQMGCSTSVSKYGFIREQVRKITIARWKKNSWKQSNGLCFSIARNNYCPELALQFQNAGQNGEKWAAAVKKLRQLQFTARLKKDMLKQNAAEKLTTAINNPKNIRNLQEIVKKAPKV